MAEEEDSMEKMKKYGAYVPPIDKYNFSIVSLTDPSKTLEDFELFLRCLRENAEGELIKIGGRKWRPLLNDIGINRVMSILESIVHNMNALSNFGEKEVEHLYNTAKENLIQLCFTSRIECGIDRKDRDMIVGNALRVSYGFMMRAFEEGDRKFWKGSITEVHHKQEIDQPRGKGFSFNPFSWGKKGG